MPDLDLPEHIEAEIDGREGDDLVLNLRCTRCHATASRATQHAREWVDEHGDCREDGASCPWCDWSGRSEDAAAHMRPHIGATYPDRDSVSYRDSMRDAGRGGLLR